MAEGFLRSLAGNKAAVFSAGTSPQQVNPHAIVSMLEEDIDISQHTSKHVDAFKDMQFDYVLTVCDNAKESCPVFHAGEIFIHHAFPDPAACTGSAQEIREAFNHTRDLIKAYCQQFVIQYL